jgi:hypothetical protein
LVRAGLREELLLLADHPLRKWLQTLPLFGGESDSFVEQGDQSRSQRVRAARPVLPRRG